MTVYELNKVGYNAQPGMIGSEIEAAKEEIRKYLRQGDREFYMLLNNDEHYYTVFQRRTKYPIDASSQLCDTIFEVIEELGTLKSVEYNNLIKGYEFWVTNDDLTKMYALFDYDWGVIKV